MMSRLAASIGAVALVTVVYEAFLQSNPTTIALSYLVVILIIAMHWNITEATVASLAAALALNFFFLPPVGTFTIADPQNWVTLVAFLLTAIVTSQLSGRARRQNLEATRRQLDLERLYALSRRLLLPERYASMPGDIARHVADAFELTTVGIYDHRTDCAAWAGSPVSPAIADTLREVARRASLAHDAAGLTVIPIQHGGAPMGSIAIPDVGLSDTVLQSIASLAAIGLERARAAEATARAEAARESSDLRATILDALAHEFKTPLTAMKAASSSLLANESTGARDRELVSIVDEELDRLGALVTDAVRMLRVDAGDFTVHLARHPLAAIVAASVKQFERRLDGHTLVLRVPVDLLVDADRDLLGLALRQLVDNALKHSPPTSTIEIVGRSNGAATVDVRSSGSTIPEREQARIFQRFYRGSQARHIPGAGMGLTIVQQIARAHGGTLAVSSSPETGTTFTLSLPHEGGGA